MNDIRLKTCRFILQKDLPFDGIFLILFVFMDFFLTCLTIDTGRFEHLSEYEKNIIRILSFEGIVIQTYVFLFIFLALLILSMSFLFSLFETDAYKGNIFLLRLKGYASIGREIRIFHFLKSVLIALLSVALHVLLYSTLNLALPGSIPIFLFSWVIFIPLAVLVVLNQIIFSLLLKKRTSNKAMLHYLRERY